MNTCDKNYGCASCDSGCGAPCGPAVYDCNFSIAAEPFDPTIWNVSWCGNIAKVKIPPMAETDTTLSINFSNATLNYKAEKHTDIITGTQIGSIINIGDLRDVDVNYDTSAMCYELIYSKYGECGDGCKSPESGWKTFSIDSKGALGPQIHYVRGANRYGCPYFLDVPENPDQYWFQGWRGSDKENGYYQPRKVQELPKDSNGNFVVMSIDPVTKEPILGVIPWQCLMDNLIGGLGTEVNGVWNMIQGTPGYSSEFNTLSGAFKIFWTDWNDFNAQHPAGNGVIEGQINWNYETDAAKGSITYHIDSVYFDKFTWTPVEGVTQPSHPTLYLDAVTTSGDRKNLVPGVTFYNSTVIYPIDETVEWKHDVTIAPGEESAVLNFVYMHLVWVNDDEGYLGIQFGAKSDGWAGANCEPGEF